MPMWVFVFAGLLLLLIVWRTQQVKQRQDAAVNLLLLVYAGHILSYDRGWFQDGRQLYNKVTCQAANWLLAHRFIQLVPDKRYFRFNDRYELSAKGREYLDYFLDA